MMAATIIKKIQELSKDQEWNHQYEFPGGLKTREIDIDSPGYNIPKWNRLKEIFNKISLAEKTVLDIGSSDGYFTIMCAMRGAKSVLGIEIDTLRVERSNFAKDVLGVKNAEFEVKDLNDIGDDAKFDIVMALGLLHRIPDITQFLEDISRLTDCAILEYKTLDSSEDCCYDGKKQMKSNEYNLLYGIPTNVYVKNRLLDLGFQNINFNLDTTSHLKFKRTICVAQRGHDE